MRRRPLVLALAAGVLASGADAATPTERLVELPGFEALPRVPPLAPPQPPLAETPRLRGTVTAREQVVVGTDLDGTPSSVRVVQRLTVRAQGDYTFLIPAPALEVVAGAGSESQPGLRPNQIVWRGFSPRRKVLAAAARLRLDETAGALPLRVRISGMPVRPGPFQLVVSIENGTLTRAQAFTAVAGEAEIEGGLAALRTAAGANRPVEGRTVRIRGRSRPATVEVWAPFELRGSVRFPSGTVRGLTRTRLVRRLGRRTLRVSFEGVADRAVTPSVRIAASPAAAAAIPASARTLDDLVGASLRYARALQYRSFLANPDPRGPSSTTYVYETAVAAPSTPQVRTDDEDDFGLPVAVVLGALALLGTGLVVLWAHL